MRMVRIRWRKGEPYVANGQTYEVGKKQKSRRVREVGRKAAQPMSGWSKTIAEAFDKEIMAWASGLVSTRRQPQLEPSTVEFVVCKLARLRARLEKHGIRAYKNRKEKEAE